VAYQPIDSMRMIKAEIEGMNGVFEVTYVENLVQEINRNATIISLWLIGISVLLLIIVVLLINNTIKLALYSQRFLIRSMQLVGATRGFIRRPFLWRSVLHGFIAGLISAGALFGILKFAGSEIEKFSAVPNPEKIALIFAGLIILGMLIAWLSTYRAVQKYVRMSLDELY
jgi:cell division transport system permease protein